MNGAINSVDLKRNPEGLEKAIKVDNAIEDIKEAWPSTLGGA